MNTETTREALERARVKAESAGLEADIDLSHEANAALADAEEAYRAALAKHEAAVRAEALREAARGYWGVDGDPDYPSTSGQVRRILNRRAARIEQEQEAKA